MSNLNQKDNEFLVYFYERIFDLLMESGYNPNELFKEITTEWEDISGETQDKEFIVKIRDENDRNLAV